MQIKDTTRPFQYKKKRSNRLQHQQNKEKKEKREITHMTFLPQNINYKDNNYNQKADRPPVQNKSSVVFVFSLSSFLSLS